MTPTPERMARLHLLALDAALETRQRNGQALAADAVAVLAYDALLAPATAMGCARVLAVLPAPVLTQVKAAAGTQARRPAAGTADSVGTEAAGAVLGISARGVRKAIERGRLAAARDPVTGRWRITPDAIDSYGGRNGQVLDRRPARC